MARSIRHHLIRYGFALLSVVLTGLAFLGLAEEPGGTAVLSCMAILVSTWCGGIGPGLLATALMSLLSLLVGPPSGRLPLPVLIAAGGVLTCALVETLHVARRRAEALARTWSLGEERSRRLLETASEGILTVDTAERATYVNPRMAEMLGCTPGELLGRPCTELIGPITAPATGQDGPRRLRRRDGSELWATVSLAALPEEPGSPPGTLALITDVTGLKRAEAALRESEERYRLLFEANPHPMWVTDAETMAFLAVNAAASVHYGYSRKEFLGMTLADVRLPEEAPRPHRATSAQAKDRSYRSNSGSSRFVWRHRKKDGTPIDVEIIAHRATFQGRSAWVTMVRDVTERRRAEQTLRFLAEASEVLASSLDPAATLPEVAELAVPPLADLCAIRILDEDGALRPLAVAHADPRQRERARALFRRERPDADNPQSLDHVLRTGEPELLLQLPEARPGDHARRLQELGGRSALCAPLVAHGRTLGMICLLMAESGRRYSPADLALVEDLAHRIALAVANARLYQEAQRALRSKDEATALLDTLFATAPVGFAFHDRDLRFVRINDHLAAINGLSPAAHLGRTCPEVMPALGVAIEQMLSTVLRTGQPVLNREIHGELPSQPGADRDWLVSYYPVRTPSGEVLGIGSIVAEITERKRSEAALLRQARQAALRADVNAAFNRADVPLASALQGCARAVVRHLDAALARIWTLEVDREVLRLQCSAGLYTHTDGTHSYVPVGSRKIGLIAQQRQPVLINDVPADPRIGDRAWARREGIVAFAGYPLLVEDRLEGVIAMFARQELAEDTLDALAFVAGAIAQGVRRKRLEEERVELLARAQAARAEAEAASRAKDRFLAVLSHELRTPLTPVLVATSALLDEGAAPEVRPTLEMIRRNVELEARLIDDLLDVSLLARGGLRLEFEAVDAHEAIRRAVEICQPEVVAAGLAIVLDLPAAAPFVKADRARLLQIIWNLIRNAAKFTPPGGALTIRAQAAAGRLGVEFRDTGIGIEPETMPRIFEPFEQGSSGPRGRYSGLGLGLTISRTLAEAHGGKLTATSPGRGRGATFRLDLPTVPAPAAPPHRPHAAAGATNGIRPGLKVLLLEDNKDTLRFLALVLRKRGYAVTEAESLAAARTAAAAAPFELLISDIELPDGTGLELMAEWGRRRGVPGIAMSGFGTEEDVRQSQDAGFAAHLTKPVDVGRLEEAIRRVVPAAVRAPVAPTAPGGAVTDGCQTT